MCCFQVPLRTSRRRSSGKAISGRTGMPRKGASVSLRKLPWYYTLSPWQEGLQFFSETLDDFINGGVNKRSRDLRPFGFR